MGLWYNMGLVISSIQLVSGNDESKSKLVVKRASGIVQGAVVRDKYQ